MSKKTTPNFEKQMVRLQAVVQELERSDLSLERNVALYKEGKLLAQSCKQLLEEAHNEILLCSENGAEPFAIFEEGASEDAEEE